MSRDLPNPRLHNFYGNCKFGKSPVKKPGSRKKAQGLQKSRKTGKRDVKRELQTEAGSPDILKYRQGGGGEGQYKEIFAADSCSPPHASDWLRSLPPPPNLETDR